MPTTRRIDEAVRLLRGFAPEAVTGASVLDLCLDTDLVDSSMTTPAP